MSMALSREAVVRTLLSAPTRSARDARADGDSIQNLYVPNASLEVAGVSFDQEDA